MSHCHFGNHFIRSRWNKLHEPSHAILVYCKDRGIIHPIGLRVPTNFIPPGNISLHFKYQPISTNLYTLVHRPKIYLPNYIAQYANMNETR